MMKTRGFTLIELLLALAIFAYASASILKMVSQSAQNTSMLEKMTFASWVAQNRLAVMRNELTWPPKDNLKGEVEMAGVTWFWRQTVTETADPRMRAVKINVFESVDGVDSTYELETYVVQQQQSSGTGRGSP